MFDDDDKDGICVGGGSNVTTKMRFFKAGGCVNPYDPDVAHHIINQLSKLLLRTHSALECEANESVHRRTF